MRKRTIIIGAIIIADLADLAAKAQTIAALRPVIADAEETGIDVEDCVKSSPRGKMIWKLSDVLLKYNKVLYK